MFINNGYKEQSINDVKEKVEQKLQTEHLPTSDNMKFINWNLPYIRENCQILKKKVHDLNKNLPKALNVRPVFQTLKTAMFFRNKDAVSSDLKAKCTYSYTCVHLWAVQLRLFWRNFQASYYPR